MIVALQDRIANYINKNADLSNWESIREYYAKYSYLTFASLIAYKLAASDCIEAVYQLMIEKGFEDAQNLAYLISTEDADTLISEIIEVASAEDNLDIHHIYQIFLTRDYVMNGGTLIFEYGKNNRDTLGSYYTQESFAMEITTKAIHDYLKVSKKKILRIADYSCGGGAFLVAACKLCRESGCFPKIYGYDVDPIAVMITRYRLSVEIDKEKAEISIKLGNPLIRKNSECTELSRFKSAIAGRFYNKKLAIYSENNVDIILGNPPWEKIRFEEKKFLKHYAESADISTKVNRETYLIKISDLNRSYYESFADDYRYIKNIIKKDTFFNDSNCGELNTYALFTELCLKSLSANGIAGIIVKTSLLKMPVYHSFFRSMQKNEKLYEIYLFVNRKKIFNIDSREEFSVIYLGSNHKDGIGMVFDLDDYTSFSSKEKILVSHQLLNKINPDTGLLPNIKNREELEFLISVYDNNQVFGQIYSKCRYGRLVHLTNHSKSISKSEDEGYLPIYEGKFIEIYTAKYATFRNIAETDKYKNKAAARTIDNIEGDEYPEARFFISEPVWRNLSKNFKDDYMIAWRSLTATTNRRTMLATALPLIPTCQSIQLLQLPKNKMLHVLAIFNSIIFDYIVRMKMAGLDLTQTIIKQMPVPSEDKYEEVISFDGMKATIESHINSRIKALYRSDNRMNQLFDGIASYEILENDRKKIISEIDRLVARLYGLDDKRLKLIAKTFNKFYHKNEIEEFF